MIKKEKKKDGKDVEQKEPLCFVQPLMENSIMIHQPTKHVTTI
jgi:hypothetical protein